MSSQKFIYVLSLVCLSSLAWSSAAQATIIDNFEDGNFTANPTWTRIAGPGNWSVATDPGGTGTLAFKAAGSVDEGYETAGGVPNNVLAGITFSANLHSPDLVDTSLLNMIYWRYTSPDGSDFIGMEWGSNKGKGRLVLSVYVDGVAYENAVNWSTLVPHLSDHSLHTVELGFTDDGTTAFVRLDGGTDANHYRSMTLTGAFGEALTDQMWYASKLGTYSAFIDNIEYCIIPEPSSVMLLASGLLGLLVYVWRRRG